LLCGLCLLPHATRLIETEEYEGSSCDFSPRPTNVVRYHAERQTVIDWFNIELEGVVAEVAEPEDKARGLLSSTTSNKASDIQRVRRARCVDDFVTPRHQR